MTVEKLARILYDGSFTNLAETLARECGKAQALSFFVLMDEDTRNFWRGIAKQIIDHSREWQPNEGSGCVLSNRERERLAALPRISGESE